jgi:hypothetical protein
MNPRLRRWLREPLVHFFLLGAVLFALYAIVNPDAAGDPAEIVVDERIIDGLATRFERTWRRQPTAQELDALIDNWVREEVLYREGLALGFDRDDPVVRRRIAQKLEFVADAGAEAPDDAALEAWLADHAQDYLVPARFHFEQRYFGSERHGDGLDRAVSEALAKLQAGVDVAGDGTLLPARVDGDPAGRIDAVFGLGFAAQLEALPQRIWAGPVESAFGAHLVRVTEHFPVRQPELAEVREAVSRDAMRARTDAADAAFFQSILQRYTVRIEAPRLARREDG